MAPEIRVRPMRDDGMDAVIRLWHETSRVAYPYLPLQQPYPLESRAAFFRERIAPECELFVAESNGVVLGYMAIKGSYFDQLYIHPGTQRRGAGTALLRKARELSPAGLELHTHQQNMQACAFYEKHGFVAVKLGICPAPESAPDVEYHWRPPPQTNA